MEKSALIVAGGIGKRLDSHTPKQFLILGDKPVLMHTLSKFSHLDKIYLVLPKKYFEKWRALCEKYNFEPSDCYFLATTKDPYYEERRRMKWNDNARICITPLLGDIE